MDNKIFLGGGGQGYTQPQWLRLDQANRHGLISGATGTGKTVTLQILAEGFSAAGVPVFLSDVKGDLSGLAYSGSSQAKLHDAFMSRADTIGLDLSYQSFPTVFWDLFGQDGHPVRTTISEMGPLLLSRLLELSDVQEGVLNIAFRIADEQGLALLDLKDLRAVLAWLGENAKDVSLRYGNVSTSSIGAIQRQLLVLENQGGSGFFGEPALELPDLIRCAKDGRGIVNILAAHKLMSSPRLYATFLLWLLSELFEELPEVGNPDKPKLVLFFDEAHLLFDDAPKALMDKVEQVARLIRSKGVGVYFITQNPTDVPDDILSQLGNRVQHALRAFTANDKKALKLAAQTYYDNPSFKTEEAIQNVGTGEAVTSMLDQKSRPQMVERTLIRPPSSQLGPLSDEQRKLVVESSDLHRKYQTPLDSQSAFELLNARAEARLQEVSVGDVNHSYGGEENVKGSRFGGTYSRPDGDNKAKKNAKKAPSFSGTLTNALSNALLKELNGTTGRRLVRGLLGGLFR